MVQTESSDKIELILQAAQQRFGQYGFSKTSMNDIADDLGLSKAALYYYFPDKEALFQAVVLKEEIVLTNATQVLRQQGLNAVEMLIKYVEMRHEHFKKLVNLVKVKNEWHKNYTPAFVQMSEQIRLKEVDRIQSIFQLGVENGEFRPTILPQVDLFMRLMQGLRLVMMKRKEMHLLETDDYDSLGNDLREMTNLFIKANQQK
jgi:AcrR family transcriptional regulator